MSYNIIYNSGIGTVAALVAILLGCTLIFITCMLKLTSLSGSEAKVKHPLCCISLICSYMHTFPIKVQFEILAWYEANA